MNRKWVLSSLLLLVGCGQHSTPPLESPPLLTSRSQIESHLGKLVTIQGEVSNTKIPQILGVEIQEPVLRGRGHRVTGVLKSYIVGKDEYNWGHPGTHYYIDTSKPDKKADAPTQLP